MTAVLVIDDEWSIRATVRLLLEHQGLAVTTAANGREGLQRFREQKPDIVLTDLHMPRATGFEVIQAVVQERVLSSLQTRVVAMSGGAVGCHLLEMAQDSGATSILRKPFRRHELLAAVGLSTSRPRSELMGPLHPSLARPRQEISASHTNRGP